MKNLAKQHRKTVEKERKKINEVHVNQRRKLTCYSDSDETAVLEQGDIVTKPSCQACQSTEQEDKEMGLERLWVQGDSSDSEVHPECLSD